MARAQTIKPVEEPVMAAPAVHTETFEEKLERQRVEESVKVKGVFQDNELPNGCIRFAFKKFPGDQIQEYTLISGQEYELPLAVVKHLNSNCFYAQDAYVPGNILDPSGKPMKNPNAKKFHRFAFKIAGYS